MYPGCFFNRLKLLFGQHFKACLLMCSKCTMMTPIKASVFLTECIYFLWWWNLPRANIIVGIWSFIHLWIFPSSWMQGSVKTRPGLTWPPAIMIIMQEHVLYNAIMQYGVHYEGYNITQRTRVLRDRFCPHCTFYYWSLTPILGLLLN